MNFFKCEKVPLVIEAVRCGDWPDGNDAALGGHALRMHAAICPECADTALAAQLLQELNTRDISQAKLPNGGLIWWKAQLAAKRAAAERATQPISIVERVCCACAALSALGILVWQWSSIKTWFVSLVGGLSESSLPTLDFLSGAWETSTPIIILCASVLLIAFSFLGYAVWTEE